VVSTDDFEKARQYSLDKNSFSLLTAPSDLLQDILFVAMDGLPFFWFGSA
jgi:hypothetical protein